MSWISNMKWYQKRMEEGTKALPENLRNRLHEDWVYPMNKIPRALTAFDWGLPKILIGYNVRRWDTAENGDEHTMEYPFGKKWVWWWYRTPVADSLKYGPNAIQKILGSWKVGFHIARPFGIHLVIKLWKFKEPTQHELDRGYDGRRLIYIRVGGRWDSYDAYWQCPAWFFGLTFN